MVEAPSPLPHQNDTYEFCIILPPRINSAGIWENLAYPSTMLTYSLPLLEMQIVVIFVSSHLIFAILKPLGITLFASQIIAGLILGPPIMGKLNAFRNIFYRRELGVEMIDAVSVFGFTLFIFLTGVKMDVKMAFNSTKKSVVIGIISLLSPIVVGILKIINSELGRLALSSASVGDLSTLFLVHIISLSHDWATSPLLALQRVLVAFLFITVLFFVFRPMMFWIIKKTPEGEPIEEVYIVAILMVAIGCAIFTHWTQQAALIGAFLFGLAVPDGPPLGSTLINKFECFVNGIFLAVYITASAMRVNPRKMVSNPPRVKFSIISFFLTFLAKFISCFIASFVSFMPFRDSLAFGLIMSSKGVVELAFFSTFRDNWVISEATFSVAVFAILVNATVIPLLVRFLYDPVSRKYAGYAGYQRRNLMHLKPDAELRVLACIHWPENVSAMIDLLDLTCPMKESPNVIYALHLIELMARDSPVFIAHHKHETNTTSANNWGLVTVNAFTAISPPKLMHEDICTMALDKQTSFIILPFHRKWSVNGSVEAENNVVRNVNCSVLDQSPCSVGILIDRGGRRIPMKSSSYSVGILFLGGKDDREALTLAKRMARDPRVKLTVIRLIAYQDRRDVLDWDTIMDIEILKDVKQNNGVLGNGCDMMYVEQVSDSGSQTAKIIRTVADDYDLIIVGRRYGVESIQSMGIVGDLFASTDIDSRVSVLVVQQQHYIAESRH
ncbi:hypothetical protein ES332_A08G007000v1 [Gossypium tomentosum]|uniref:Uncharacterized protein n=1 Tax=Gossypium tomentosum TaxID=34277 RepID=A0A5D2PA12_GOSTO|nr:hypothetical protein ES332_A08G007000v1 [Gossypium tomentosum]